MTVWLRDASNFDGTVSFDGLAGFTHKATEGISVVHDRYGPRLTAARDAGVPVLGAYHVLRSPSAANGSYAAQLAFWLGYLDAHTPWWRSHPHFILQIDAERWSYDNVSAAEVLTFAALLAGSGEPGWKVTYASRGQYGDSLKGIATPLWNADYRGGPAYPGDGWVSSGGSPAGWAPYSGQTPVILQFTSTGYDHNAYRGTLLQLLALTAQNGATTMDTADSIRLKLIYENWSPTKEEWVAKGGDPARYDALTADGSGLNGLAKALADLAAAVKAVGVDAHAAASLAPVPFTDQQAADFTKAVTDQVEAGLAAIGEKLDSRFASLEKALGAAIEAAGAVLNPPAA